MAVFVSLLYSVTLPCGAPMPMTELRDLAGAIGLEAVRSVGAMGSLMFGAPEGRAINDFQTCLEQVAVRAMRKAPPGLLEALEKYRRGEDLMLTGDDLWVRLPAEAAKSRIIGAFDTRARCCAGAFRSLGSTEKIAKALAAD